jgi:hypothetical protein
MLCNPHNLTGRTRQWASIARLVEAPPDSLTFRSLLLVIQNQGTRY